MFKELKKKAKINCIYTPSTTKYILINKKNH